MRHIFTQHCYFISKNWTPNFYIPIETRAVNSEVMHLPETNVCLVLRNMQLKIAKSGFKF